MAPGVGNRERRNPHQPVHPGLALQPAIGIVAIDPDGGGLQPDRLPFAFLDQLQLVAMLFGPACVHAKQHRGPVLAFGAACPGMDFDIGVIAIGLAREHGLKPLLFGAPAERGYLFLGIGHQGGIAFGLGHLDHAGGISWSSFSRARTAWTARHPASGVRASVSARSGSRSRDWGLRPWRSVHPGGGRICPSQRCLLSRAMACSMSATWRWISGRMVLHISSVGCFVKR